MVRIVTALSGLVLVVLALRLAMAPLFPLDKFVAPAITALEADTGTVIKFEKADIALLPTPSVVMADVGIELPDGLGSVHAERLSLALNPLPFLSGSAELGSVTIEKPEVRLSLGTSGLDPAKAIGALTDLARRASDRHFLATDGRLVLMAQGMEASLDDVTASASRTDVGERLVFKMMLHGKPLSLAVETGTTGAAKARVDAPMLNANLDGGLAGGAFAGRLDLMVPDAASLGGAFAQTSGPFQLNGAVTLANARVELVDASVVAFGSRGRLSAALDLGASPASVDLHADFDRLPVDSLAKLASLAARLGFNPTEGAAPFDAGLDLKLAELTLPGGEIKDIRLTAVDRGKGFGALFDGAVGSGRLSGRLDLAPEGEGRRLGASFALKDVGIEDVTSLAGLAFLPVSGRLAADLRLSAHGRSGDELAATLAVDGSGQLREGRLGDLPLAGGLALPALEGFTADVSVTGLDKPARLTGQGVSSSGAVTIEATAPPRRLLEGGAAPVDVRFEGPALSANFLGEADPGATSASGSLSLTTRSLSKLTGVAGVPQDASLDGQLEAASGHFTLSDAQLMLGDGAFGGLLDLSAAGDRRKLTGRLAGDVIDIPALAGAVAGLMSGENRQVVAATDADLRIEAGRLVAGPVAAAGGPVDLRLKGEDAEIGLSRLSVGGGGGSAVLAITAGDRPAYTVKGKLEGARLASLAPLIGTVADGELSLAIDASAAGKNKDDLIKSATGTADFSVAHGTLDGLDPLALIGRVARSVQTGFGADPGRFGFDELSGRVRFAKRVATAGSLAFAAGDLQLSGSGSLGLSDGVLDLRIKPKMKNLPDFEAPIAVVGPLASPRLYPDLPGLVGDPASGYARLALMGGGFAHLVGGESSPKLEAIEPDAMTSMIGKLSEAPKAVEETIATGGDVVSPVSIAPLPLVRPALPRNSARSHVSALAGGPLDLGALGREVDSSAPKDARGGACRPGRDGRCIP